MIGVDIEQYDSSNLQGLLQDRTGFDIDTINAFQSYLAIVPSAPVAFDSFAGLVSKVIRNIFPN